MGWGWGIPKLNSVPYLFTAPWACPRSRSTSSSTRRDFIVIQPAASFSLCFHLSSLFFSSRLRPGAPVLPGAQTCPAQSEDPMIRSGVNSHMPRVNSMCNRTSRACRLKIRGVPVPTSPRVFGHPTLALRNPIFIV